MVAPRYGHAESGEWSEPEVQRSETGVAMDSRAARADGPSTLVSVCVADPAFHLLGLSRHDDGGERFVLTNSSHRSAPVAAVTVGAPAIEVPLDPIAIEELRSGLGSTGALRGLVELFRTQTLESLGDTRKAIEVGDARLVSGIAHKLRGGCGGLAAIHMAALCTELGVRADSGSLQGAAALVDQIEAAFEAAHATLLVEVNRDTTIGGAPPSPEGNGQA